MGKVKIPREVTAGDISCLENVVVAYNTVFLMSSIFIVLIASTTRELFSDFNRILSPSLLLLMIGCFIVFIAGIGYVGVGKKSSSLISMFTMLLIFVFVIEITAGFGILSYRREIRTIVSSKMRKAINAYPSEPMTANLVDYVQLQFECCGVTTFRDWTGVFKPPYETNCKMGSMSLPLSCCTKSENSTILAPLTVNSNGCVHALNFMLHKSSLALTSAIIAICTVQILGAYFSYSLASTLTKYKAQQAAKKSESLVTEPEPTTQVNLNEKSNYF